ncbi:MAG: hypothetical protein ACPGRZ_06155 [Alphaproteobacteria bacterium]
MVEPGPPASAGDTLSISRSFSISTVCSSTVPTSRTLALTAIA